MPDRKTISDSLIPRMYNDTKEVIFKSYQKLMRCADWWTSINNQSFTAITAHFNDDDKGKHMFKSYLLGCIPFDERHTTKNLSDQLKIQANEWGISNKITCIISDNASNITAAIRITTWRFLPCYAHTLNLVLQA
ncbi:hypothetical protein NQ314_001910 [Rhamnusium bicolor]|uniref:DUF659 domain-containing protein n=1 Tax=Rhamnusium bicolor TaxID=1586634 RepID=A0AAV8ZSZ9_9CUCU|nr:hypothetical protein NQ314_001910 [Rhamnusium bicolor]